MGGIIDQKSPVAMYSKQLAPQEIASQGKELKFTVQLNMAQIYISQGKPEKGIDM